MEHDDDNLPETTENGPARDARGRLLPGHKYLGGGARRTDLKSAMTERLGQQEMDDRLLFAFNALCRRAARGNVPACRVLFERICGPVPTQLDANATQTLAELIVGTRRLQEQADQAKRN